MTTKYTPTVIRVATSTATGTKPTAPRRRPRCKNKTKHNESENRRRERLRTKFDELREVLDMEDPTDRCTLLDRAVETIRNLKKKYNKQIEQEEMTNDETMIKTESQQETSRVTRNFTLEDKESKSMNPFNTVDVEIAHVNMHSIDESVVAAVTAAARSASASLSNSPVIVERSISPVSSISSSSHSPHSPSSPEQPIKPAPISSLAALAAAARRPSKSCLSSIHESSSIRKYHDEMDTEPRKRRRLSTSSTSSSSLPHSSDIHSPRQFTPNASFPHTPTALLTLDGRILDVNLPFCSLLQHDQHHLITQTIFAITHPIELPYLFEIMKRMLAGEIPSYDGIQRCIRRDGSLVMVTINLVMVAQGEMSYFLCSASPSTSTTNSTVSTPTSDATLSTPLKFSTSPQLPSRALPFPSLSRTTSPPPSLLPRPSSLATGSAATSMLSSSAASPSLSSGLAFPLFARSAFHRAPQIIPPVVPLPIAPLMSRLTFPSPAPVALS